jgi:hypothetical protein
MWLYLGQLETVAPTKMGPNIVVRLKCIIRKLLGVCGICLRIGTSGRVF